MPGSSPAAGPSWTIFSRTQHQEKYFPSLITTSIIPIQPGVASGLMVYYANFIECTLAAANATHSRTATSPESAQFTSTNKTLVKLRFYAMNAPKD
ncbi:MAG TPA: hypothetical protein VFT78_00435 [Hanamia sp.]|nr:hypothetical protein [Hanamia sp.]